MSHGTFDSNRRDYENTNVVCDDGDRMPVVVNTIPKIMRSERRKPYYYNELNIMPTNDLIHMTSHAEENEANASTQEHEISGDDGSQAVALDDDELVRNTMFNAKLLSGGSGDSLDNVV